MEFLGGLVVRIWCFHCRGPGSIPDRGTEIPQAMLRSQKEKKLANRTQQNFKRIYIMTKCGLFQEC